MAFSICLLNYTKLGIQPTGEEPLLCSGSQLSMNIHLFDSGGNLESANIQGDGAIRDGT
ncbi:hypothetical protein [Salinibacter ruber]|jgi:hypothetical protein|uniref:hypothetical protein n=1 Tax=Salinibacter ruber TaxID=146919 RepID=UPI002168EB6F|nr:hypothetical protein [Salinibacter ruber]